MFDNTSKFDVTTDTIKGTIGGTERLVLDATTCKLVFNSSNSLIMDTNSAILKVANLDVLSCTGPATVIVNKFIQAGSDVYPKTTASSNLGTTSLRWNNVYGVNAHSASSDETLKENIEALPEALLDAWGKHVNPKQYNWIDSDRDDKKHISFIAQDIIKAFDEAGLDWREYGIISGDGVVVKFGVSYTDAHIIETAYQRRKIAQLEAKLAQLGL